MHAGRRALPRFVIVTRRPCVTRVRRVQFAAPLHDRQAIETLSDVRVHHIAIAGGVAWGSAVPLREAGVLRVGDEIGLVAGPNLFIATTPGLSATHDRRPVNAPGIAHLCIQSRGGDAARAALEEDGVAFLSPPVALGTGFLYAYGHDRGGRLIELETAPALPGTPVAWFGHIAFVSPDAERLAAFYGDLLGDAVEVGGRFRDHPGVDRVAGLNGVDLQAWWVRAGGFTLEFWRYHAPAAPVVDSRQWYQSTGLQSDDLGATCVRIFSLGGTVERGIRSGPDGRSCLARDPDGNELRLIELDNTGWSVDALPDRDVLARA